MSTKRVFKLSKLVQKAFRQQKRSSTVLLHDKMDEIKPVEEEEEEEEESDEHVIGSFLEDVQAMKNQEEIEKKRGVLSKKRRVVDMEMDILLAEPPASWAVVVLERAVKGVHREVGKFTDCLISHMLAAEWDLEAATDAIEPGIELSLPSHKKFIFNSFVAHCIMEGFEDPHFDLGGGKRNSSVNTSMFECFCQKKFRRLVHPKMEESLLRERGKKQFYGKLLELGKAVWLLHSLALSLDPPPSIFEAERGIPFSPYSMLDIVPSHYNYNYNATTTTTTTRAPDDLQVGFTIMPGFHVGNNVIKCLVYAITSSTPHHEM